MKSYRTTTISLLIPSFSIFSLIFLAPLLYFFVVSFWRKKRFQLIPDATISNYIQVFEEYTRPLWFTFGVATIIGLVTTILAFTFAYVIRFKSSRYSLHLLFIVLITLFGGYLTKIYVWKTILGQTGILNTALMMLNIIDEPIMMFLFNPIAVVISLAHYMLPLAVLPIYGALRSIDDTSLRGALDLGASRFRVFWDIVLPQCQMGIMAAFTLTFLFAAGDWVTPKLVGGPYTSMIGTFIQYQYGSRFNQPLGSALAFTVIAISLLILVTIALVGKRILKPR